MDRSIQKIGVVNWITLLAVGVVSAWVARYAASATGRVGATFVGIGFLIAAVSYFQMRLEERERLEKLEFDELAKSRGGSGVFAATAAETFPARRAREQFERVFVPGFAVMVFLLQSSRAVFLLQLLQ